MVNKISLFRRIGYIVATAAIAFFIGYFIYTWFILL